MPGAASVDNRCNARADPENIRVDAEGAEAFHEVQVNIDQPRSDDVILDIDHGRAIDVEIGADDADFAIAYADVELAVSARGGIDKAAAFEEVFK